MEYIILTSYVITILVAIGYTVITVKSEKIDNEGLFIMWAATILGGWVLGIVFLGVLLLFYVESLTKKKNETN